MDLTLQELVILIVLIAVVASVIVAIIKSSIKIACIGLVVFVLFSGFTWLPEKIAEITGSDPITDEEIQQIQDEANGVVEDIYNTGKDFYDENKDSWISAAESLWQKLTGQNNETEGEPVVTDETTN